MGNMRKARTLLIFGIWTALLPYSGFPIFLKSILFSLTGFGLVYLAFLSYKEYKKGEIKNKTFDSFRENRDFETETMSVQEE